MKLTRMELSLLRLTDGIASTADIDRLRKHFDADTIDSWRGLSRWIAVGVTDPVLVTGDFRNISSRSQASTTSQIDVSEKVMERLGLLADHKALDGNTVRSALMDHSVPDLSENIMSKILAVEPGIDDINQNLESEELESQVDHKDSRALVKGETDDSNGVTPSQEMSDLSAEDWSFNSLLLNALLDPNSDSVDVADSVERSILSPQMTEDLLQEVLNEELESSDESSTLNALLIEGLEAELNRAEESIESPLQEQDEVSSNSLMDFEDEIPSPVIAQREVPPDVQTLLYTDDVMVVEFTEEEEFSALHSRTQPQDFEEDSDEELCSVDEAFVSEAMLIEQETGWFSLKDTLLIGGDTNLDIWNAVSKKVSRPPLRLLKDDTGIEVVDKVPVSTKSESNSLQQTNSSVEFLNSKSIDADSTISKVSVTVLGSFLTLAAAWMIIVLPSLLTQTTSTINTPKRIVTFEVAEVNQLEVEDLEVAEDMNVQILQGDGNAPTIIFLDEMEAL